MEQDNNLKIVCISDTHTNTKNLKLPKGDILIHSGDFTYNGSLKEVIDFNDFLGKQRQFKNIIVIAGNHDISFDTDNYEQKFELKKYKNEKYFNSKYIKSNLTNCIYLENSSVELFGYKFYGSPYTRKSYDWGFQKDNQYEMKKNWQKIPNDTDILITHCPPYLILDETKKGKNAGCAELYSEIVDRVKPIAHIFGHIHEGYGTLKHRSTYFVNCAICTKEYLPTNSPIVIDIPIKKDIKK